MSFTNMTEQVEPSPKTEELVRAVSNHQTPMAPLDLVEEQRPRAKLRIWAILIALYLALFVAALDQTIIATSIPTISAQLHSAAGYFWIGGAYLLANAAAAPIWAKCSDIWGRKPALLGAVALFAIASIIAATSVSMTMLIAARALQGTAGGGLLQLVTITISDLFSMRRRTLYLGLLEVMWAVAGGAGPLIGGAFTQLVSWRWCFWINLPVSGVTFLLLFLFLDVHNPRTRLREGLAAIDWLGTLSVLAVTLMLLLGLDFGGTVFPWSSAKVICLIVFGTLMIGCFIFSEKRLAKYPLMPLDMFKDMSNVALFLVGFSQGMVFIAAEYYLPLYLQSVKQASPLRSGVLI
ncbi:putative MFS transporter, partial [Hortaea werneckii]